MAIQWKIGQLAIAVSLVLVASAGCAAASPAADLSEAEAPDSVLNKDRTAPVQASPERYSAQLRAAEVGNPDSIDAKLAPAHLVAPDEQQFRADEAGNPHSVDSRLLPSRAMLQRLHAYDSGKIAVAQLARQNGSEASAAFASKIVQQRETAEQQIAALARKLFISLEQPSDRPARNQLAADRATLARLQQAKGSEFDRSFARQMQQPSDLEAVRVMRTKCVEPDVCSMLDQLLPVLQSEQADAQSLGIAVCGSQSC